MPARGRLLIGAITTVAFVGVGASLIGSGRTVGGAVVLGLGLFRGVAWITELRRAFADDG